MRSRATPFVLAVLFAAPAALGFEEPRQPAGKSKAPVDPAAETAEWAGADDMGNPVPHGRYGFAIESWEGETLLDTQVGTVFAAVTEVRVADGQQILVLEDGSRVTLDQVSAVR